MKTQEKVVDQYIRDKYTQNECVIYIEGWQDAYMEGYNASETKAVKVPKSPTPTVIKITAIILPSVVTGYLSP